MASGTDLVSVRGVSGVLPHWWPPRCIVRQRPAVTTTCIPSRATRSVLYPAFGIAAHPSLWCVRARCGAFGQMARQLSATRAACTSPHPLM